MSASPKPASPKADLPDARAQRLAAALRENLRRRKAQARSQASAKQPARDAEQEEP
jgi:hypothetical protein